MKKILLFVKDSDSARDTAKRVNNFLKSLGYEVETFINLRDSKPKGIEGVSLVIVIGGDGTFLSAARLFHSNNLPLLGINEGKFGFLTEVEKNRVETVISKVLEDSISPQKRMMISAYLNGRYLGSCLNDVVISKGSIARMVEVDLYIQQELVVRVYGDGVIVSTPTGSTAYALSSGGPIIYPLSENILFVPISPHTLSNRPLVLPAYMELLLECQSPKDMAYLTLDGQEVFQLEKGDKVLVRKSLYYCIMYPDPDRSFFGILKEKLRWG